MNEEINSNLRKIVKILDFFLNLEQMSDIYKNKEIENTPFPMFFAYENLPKEVYLELKNYYEQNGKSIKKLRKHFNHYKEESKEECKLCIKQEKQFSIAKILKFDYFFCSDLILVYNEDNKPLDISLSEYLKEINDPEIWEKTVRNTFKCKVTALMLGEIHGNDQTNVEEILEFFEAFNFDAEKIIGVFKVVSNRLENNMITLQNHVHIKNIKPKPLFKDENITYF